MTIIDEMRAALESLERALTAATTVDRREKCPNPCPAKKAAKKGGPAHVCTTVQGDGLSPLLRMREAMGGQPKAATYDPALPSLPPPCCETADKTNDDDGWRRATSDPTGNAAVRHDPVAMDRKQLERDVRTVRHHADRLERILANYPAPQPATAADRARLARANHGEGPPPCRFCGLPVLLNDGRAALSTDVKGNLETKGPTCGRCVQVVQKTGQAPTRQQVTDIQAGRQVRYPKPGKGQR